MVEDWYRGEVAESDLRFLRGRYDRLTRSKSPPSPGPSDRSHRRQQQEGVFTELFLAAVVQLMEAERGDETVQLLPDLQVSLPINTI